jgi:lipopolysaccharide export system protein LptA
MALSIRNAFLLACALSLQAAHAAPKSAPLPIDFTAQSFEIDWKNSFTSYKKVQITQGNMSITADQGQVKGTTVSFADSHWVFRGSVKILVQDGTLNSDEAQAFFNDNQLTRATATGKPATFQQKIPNADKTVNGHSDNIDYDAAHGMVHLTTDAWLSDGQNEIRDQSLRYDMIGQRLIADQAEQQGQRVHIIVTPPPPKSQATAPASLGPGKSPAPATPPPAIPPTP